MRNLLQALMNQKKQLTKVDTGELKTIEEIANFFKSSKNRLIKSMLLKSKNGWVMALIRGDYEINLSKLRSLIKDQTLDFAQPEEVYEKFGVNTGYIGPINVPKDVKIVADFSVKSVVNGVIGAMEENKHYINATPDEDFKVDIFLILDL